MPLSKADEAAFMADLLGGLDGDLFNQPMSSQSQPASQARRPPLSKLPANSQSKTIQQKKPLAPLKSSVVAAPLFKSAPQKTLAPSTAKPKAALAPKQANFPTNPLAARTSAPKQISSTPVAKAKRDYADLLDGIDSWSDDDDFPAPDAAKNSTVAILKITAPIQDYVPISQQYLRCYVVSVDIIQNGYKRQKLVQAKVERNKDPVKIVLEDLWYETGIEKDDIIHVVGQPDQQSTSACATYTISSAKNNLLILHPDTLISATRASDAFTCSRKPVLQEKLRESTDTSLHLMYGNLLHELFQACLSRGIWDSKSIEAEIDRLLQVPENIEYLYKLDLETTDAKKGLLERSESFAVFSETFVGEQPKAEAYLTDPRSRDPKGPKSTKLAVSKVHDIEEEIWSPRLGLKGKIDASVQAVLQKPNHAPQSIVTPFEIKTGRNSALASHRAQTMLYTYLMSERYDHHINEGLLFYSKDNDVIRVDAAKHELHGLIVGRNEMARFLTPRKTVKDKKRDELGEEAADISAEQSTMDIDFDDLEERPLLPAPIDEYRNCKGCFSKDACMLYRKAIDKTQYIAADDDPLQILYTDKTSHITDNQAEFFKHWEELLSLEEKEMNKYKKEIWTMTAEARQKEGRCLSRMVVDFSNSKLSQAPATSRVHRKFYRLVPEDATVNILSGHLNTGDAIVVSIDADLLAVARGYVLKVRHRYIEIGVDHSLEILPGDAHRKASRAPVFRIDKDEFGTGLGRIRDNLAQLFYAPKEGQGHKNGLMKRRRDLIVDLKEPSFTSLANGNGCELDGYDLKNLSTDLNADQRQAIENVARAKDYSLILGMPGTGKTKTISELVKFLVKSGKSVLLTSYTHSAVDNILLKLDGAGFDILRLGNVDKVMESLQHLTLAKRKPPTSLEEIKELLDTPQVVATTSLTINHAIFSRRHFDYCIVDEASQITLPTCLGPLQYADRFILVGDHKQLPPLVRNPQARDNGLTTSLFKLLAEAHPHVVVNLSYQYRMNSDIMTVSNALTYGGLLKCGNAEVANRTLKRPLVDNVHQKHQSCGESCWIRDLLEEDRKFVFVDTDDVPAEEVRPNALVENPIEADLIFQTAESLIQSGVRESDIGVIGLYRQQIKLLNARFSAKYPNVEILTADKSQGRDKECILMSLTRSNAEKSTGALLKDERRMNVCFTRAKSKLIVFGSRSTISTVPLLSQFFSLIDCPAEHRNWVYKLKPGAHTMHDDMFSMPSGTAKSVISPVVARRGGVGSQKGAKRLKMDGLVGEGDHDGSILADIINQ